jgi:hypothetical protein
VVGGLDTCGVVRVRTASLFVSGVFVPGFSEIGCGGAAVRARKWGVSDVWNLGTVGVWCAC